MSLLRNPAENPSNQRCPGLTAKPKVRLGDRGEFCYIIGKEFHKKKIPLSKHTRTQACASTHVHTHTEEKPTFNTEFPFLSQGLIFASSNKETARRGRGWKAKSSEGRETQAAAPCEAPGSLRLLSLFLEPFRPQTCWADQGQHSDETVQTCLSFQALPPSSLALLSPHLCSDVEKTLYYTWEALGCRAEPRFVLPRHPKAPRCHSRALPTPFPARPPPRNRSAKLSPCRWWAGFAFSKGLKRKQGGSRERLFFLPEREQPSLHPGL